MTGTVAAGLPPVDREAVAAQLAQAEADRAPIPPLTATWQLTVEDAYAIQQRNVARRIEAGASVCGHKIGLSSRAMQQMLGVGEPDFGHLLDDMVVDSGAVVPADRYCSPRVEIELAFVLGAPLPGEGCTVADVLRATELVVPAIEIIDSRIRDWKIRIEDTVADNASSAGVVLGGNGRRTEDLDLRLTGGLLEINGEVLETGCGAAVLGHPATSVAWLARALARYGVRLDAGEVVLSGACTRAVDVGAGDVVRAEFAGLGAVSVRFG